MDNPAQDIAQSTSEVAQVNNNLHNKKILVIGLILIIGLTAVALGWYYFPKQTQVLTRPKIVKEKSPIEKITEGHGNLFYIDLEYNPKNGAVIPKDKGRVNGDLSLVNTSPPSSNEGKFIYKVEVISDQDELLLSGWVSTYKEIIEKPNGLYYLRVYAPFKYKATITVSATNGDILYTGEIK